MPTGASILLVRQPWLGLLLAGQKSLEIRGSRCNKDGQRIYLALPGAGGLVLGSVEFTACTGPLTAAEYAARQSEHCVAAQAGAPLPYGGSTYAWSVREPVRFAEPVPYTHRPGCVVWATMA